MHLEENSRSAKANENVTQKAQPWHTHLVLFRGVKLLKIGVFCLFVSMKKITLLSEQCDTFRKLEKHLVQCREPPAVGDALLCHNRDTEPL